MNDALIDLWNLIIDPMDFHALKPQEYHDDLRAVVVEFNIMKDIEGFSSYSLRRVQATMFDTRHAAQEERLLAQWQEMYLLAGFQCGTKM